MKRVNPFSPEKISEPQAEPRFDPEIVDVVFSDSPEFSHDERWSHLDGSKAEIARRALIKAQEMRDKSKDPGDAYLEGISQALEIIRLDDEQRDDRFNRGKAA